MHAFKCRGAMVQMGKEGREGRHCSCSLCEPVHARGDNTVQFYSGVICVRFVHSCYVGLHFYHTLSLLHGQQ